MSQTPARREVLHALRLPGAFAVRLSRKKWEIWATLTENSAPGYDFVGMVRNAPLKNLWQKGLVRIENNIIATLSEQALGEKK